MAVQTKNSAPRKTKKAVKQPKARPVQPLHSPKPPSLAPKPATTRPKAGTAAKTSVFSNRPQLEAKPRNAQAKASGPSRIKDVGRKTVGPAAILKSSNSVAAVRKKLGLTQELFARLIGVTQRSVTTWENGGEINDVSLRRVREMDYLADELRKSMREDFIPHWLVSPNEGLGGISPIEAMERGEAAHVWRSVFLMGSGIPL